MTIGKVGKKRKRKCDFESLSGDESHKAEWKLSKDNSEFTIIAITLQLKFSSDYFDTIKLIAATPQIGTF